MNTFIMAHLCYEFSTSPSESKIYKSWTLVIIIIIIISLLPSDVFVAYAANISEHLPTQPWEYTHKDQTTTPGITPPTLCKQWVVS